MDDRYEIQCARTELREGYNAGDVERVLRVYSANLSDFSDGQPSFGKHDALAVLRARLATLFARYRVLCAPAAIDVVVLGATALDYGWMEFHLEERAGHGAQKQRKRYLHVWKKEADFVWRIALTIDNADLPPALADVWIAGLRSVAAAADSSTVAAELGRKAMEQALTEA